MNTETISKVVALLTQENGPYYITADFRPGCEDVIIRGDRENDDAQDIILTLEELAQALVLSVCGDGVEDDSGAVWRPDADAAAEIAASDSPESAMLRICESAPWRGEWRS